MTASALIASGIVLAGLLGVAAIILIRRSRLLAIVLGAAAVVVLAVTLAPVVLALTVRMPQPALWSNTLDEGSVGLWAEIEHERLALDGSTTVFRYGDGWDALVAELEQDYPEGEAEDDAWVVAHSGLRYRVAPGDPTGAFEGGDVYTLAAEVLTVIAPDGSFAVPFPHAGLAPEPGGQRVRLGVASAVHVTVDLPGYYRKIGAGQCDGDSCIVPTSAGGYAELTVREGSLTVSQAVAR